MGECHFQYLLLRALFLNQKIKLKKFVIFFFSKIFLVPLTTETPLKYIQEDTIQCASNSHKKHTEEVIS